MANGNLLIIDDEVVLLKRLKKCLESYADEIYLAVDGLEGLKVLETHKVNCIICDIKMPKMNGLEFIKQLRTQNDNTPLIFFTGHGNRELMLEAIKYGAFDFLDKPKLDGLEEVVSRGMTEGFERKTLAQESEEEIMNAYAKLMKEIDND